MGNRSNVIIKQEYGENLWLYSHWGGETFQTVGLARALNVARDRVGDEPYFNRILITEMFNDLLGDSTGGEVSLYETDNEHDYVVVDPRTGIITLHTESIEDPHTKKWTIDQYIEEYGG